ncbi:hypothetical protein SAMN00017405_0120 [Desulfonispora thiosulfatigenes DSM 11270]|uniref:Uncharacterized protein n=1 Tax=Desulfonispora thiosulfatigenes DSM 11270 TaxID=656914 RepID=A0A1W1VKX6_DESTI|nr:hypothetical protein [Desulfonispora thiosulfatigenes]SMB93933.1 hypothetical protein SAMN00017405_0120 [Desulfonispora thiosulfatigenes DSM 11270]
MAIKLIFEEERVKTIKREISKLDTKQLYFLEHFLNKEKKVRKENIFKEWMDTLDNILENKEYQRNNLG